MADAATTQEAPTAGAQPAEQPQAVDTARTDEPVATAAPTPSPVTATSSPTADVPAIDATGTVAASAVLSVQAGTDAAAVGSKRSAPDGPSISEGMPKRGRVGDADQASTGADAQDPVEPGACSTFNPPATSDSTTAKRARDGTGGATAAPVSFGPQSFSTAFEARNYISNILRGHSAEDLQLSGGLLNEYEHAVLGAVLRAHPHARAKIGGGVVGFRVGPSVKGSTSPTDCFFLVRADGSEEDFSYLSCLENAFAVSLKSSRQPRGADGRNGRGHGVRGGRRGRGRGRQS